MANEKKPAVKSVETEDSNRDQSTTQVVVDQIETPAELALKDQAAAQKIIDRVVAFEGDIKSAEMAINVKKVYVGCLLILSKRLATSNEAEDETEAKPDGKTKLSVFDKMIEDKKLSRATAYRRISDARAFIDAGVITFEMLAQIEKSESTSPELITVLDQNLRTPKGVKIQQAHGLLPAPETAKAEKKGKSLKEQLDEKSKQVETLLMEIKKILADKELAKGVGNQMVLEKLTAGYSDLDAYFLKFKTIEIPDLPKSGPVKELEMSVPLITRP